MAASKLPRGAVGFIRGSMFIAGLKYDPRNGETKRHREIASIVLSRSSKVINPIHINGALLGHHELGLRTGTEWDLRNKAPASKKVRGLLEKWMRCVERGIKKHRKWSIEACERFCWEMHDELRCIRPFRNENGQTARLVLNQLRVRCGLPILTIDGKNADQYHARLDAYRDHEFIPRYFKRA